MHMESKNKIGFGILCFGHEKYYNGTIKKLNLLIDLGFRCYVLTDDPSFFYQKYSPNHLDIIDYKKEIKSYHDKILLVKYILEDNDVAIIIDADMNYTSDYYILNQLKTYNFKDGITYIENLTKHKVKKETIKEFNLYLKNDWKMYFAYVNSRYGDFQTNETIWEHFLVFKNFNYIKFYKEYEKLQIIKEYCDVLENKELVGAGEGITLKIASDITNTPIQKDNDLYQILKDLFIYG